MKYTISLLLLLTVVVSADLLFWDFGVPTEISDGVQRVSPGTFAAIRLRSGYTYSGVANKNIKINNLDVMFTTSDAAPAIIECGANSRAFEITDSKVQFVNIIFNNCSQSKGATLLVTNSEVILDNVVVRNCTSDFGSAAYLTHSRLTVTGSSFVSNIAHGDGAVFLATENSEVYLESNNVFTNNSRLVSINNRIYNQKSDVALRAYTTGTMLGSAVLGATCDDTSMLLDGDLNSICSKIVPSIARSLNTTICGDGVCNPSTEDFFSCQADCSSVNFNGFLHTQSQCQPTNITNCITTSRRSLSSHEITPFQQKDGALKGELETYFKVQQNGKIYFRFTTSNLDFKVKVDNNSLIDYQSPPCPFESFDMFHNFQESEDDEQQKQFIVNRYLVTDNVHQLHIEYYTSAKSHRGNRYLSVEFSMHNANNFQPFNTNFYSFNVCGDGIFNAGENCASDNSTTGYGSIRSVGSKLLNTTCGNGICDEVDPNTCIIDCYKYITENCPPMTVRQGSIVPNEISQIDTLGILIDNQIVWRLPGYQHFTYGYDIVYGEQRSYPVFNFGFCNDKDSNILEDVYRMMFMEVPKELSVTPLPRCTFNVETKTFSNTTSMKNEMYTASSMTVNVNANGGYAGVSVEAAASYTKERSVKTSMEMESTVSGKVVSSTVNCFIYNVELSGDITFSLNFLRDVSQSITVEDFYNLIKTYGTHYYKSAILGGSLKQITSVDESIFKSKSSKEIEDFTSKSFSVKVTSPKFNVQGSYADSKSTTDKAEREKEIEEKTAKSSIITYGGAPGAYGPSEDNGPTKFGAWAESIDLLPIPVKPKLLSIHSIIPLSWKTAKGESVSELWGTAVNLYYQLNSGSTRTLSSTVKKSTTMMLINKNYIGYNMKMKQTYKSGANTVESLVDFRAVKQDTETKEFYNPNSPTFRYQYTLVKPTFKVDWEPSDRNILKLESDMSNKATTIISTTAMDYTPSDIKRVNNMAFVSSDTALLDKRLLFDTTALSAGPFSKANLPVWSARYFNSEGVMYPANDTTFGYLLIPGMPIAYYSLAINVRTGGYNYVIYVNGAVAVNERTLITIPKELLSTILVATSIDYTPNYQTFNHDNMGNQNWYDRQGPHTGKWYFNSNQDTKDLMGELREEWPTVCPAIMNYNSDGCNIKDCWTDSEMAHVTSWWIPSSEFTYFFLPNTEGKYVSVAYQGVNTQCGRFGYKMVGTARSETKEYYDHYKLYFDDMVVWRTHNSETIRSVRTGDPSDYSTDWWSAIQLPAADWFPESLDSLLNPELL
eukprot:gene19853-23783_t